MKTTSIPATPRIKVDTLKGLKKRKKEWEKLLKSLGCILWELPKNSEDTIFYGYITNPQDESGDQDIDIDFSFSEKNKAECSVYNHEPFEGTWNQVLRKMIQWKKEWIPQVPQKDSLLKSFLSKKDYQLFLKMKQEQQAHSEVYS